MPRERIDPAGRARLSEYLALIPAMLEPEDIAAPGLFLAPEEARYINGAIVTADAGWAAA